MTTPTQDPETREARFKHLKEEAGKLMAAYYNGAGEDKREKAHELATEAVQIFNETAEEIAKKFNRKATLTTVQRFLRDL